MAGFFVLVRHGETALNKEKRLRAWMDVNIDQNAEPQIEATAQLLSQLPVRAIVSSDLARARETADIIAHHLMLEVSEDQRLRPWNVGELTGQKLEAVADRMEYYISHPAQKVPGGESFNDFMQRFAGIFRELVHNAALDPSSTVVAVTHSRCVEVARYFVTGDKSTLIGANTVRPGQATSWHIGDDGTLKEVPLNAPPQAGKEKAENAASS